MLACRRRPLTSRAHLSATETRRICKPEVISTLLTFGCLCQRARTGPLFFVMQNTIPWIPFIRKNLSLNLRAN